MYNDYKNILRPCNFPDENFGVGYFFDTSMPNPVLTINVQLRVYMREHLACPFRSVEKIIEKYRDKNPIVIIDLHGEATAEKLSFAAHFDGRVSAIFGTHTHVQTADSRIMPSGTGYITDVGMVGALHSSIGLKFKNTIDALYYQVPTLHEVEEDGDFVWSAVLFSVNNRTLLCNSVESFYYIV